MNNDSVEKHAENLGRLNTNLHSLEVTIRDFLFNDAEGLQVVTKHLQSLRKLKVGQSIPENLFTNYDDLRTLIRKYNKRVEAIAKKLRVDESIVGLRDALAHGRVFSYGPSPPMLLLKFSPPQKGYVKVEFSAVMTIDWFDKQVEWVKRELDKAIEADKLLSEGKL